MKRTTTWWRRAAAAAKDRRTLCLTRVTPSCTSAASLPPDLHSAIIRATSHNEAVSDINSAARVLAWARSDPTTIEPIMWAIGRRVTRTRSWAVVLKGLMLAHGLLLLLRSGAALPIGRLPFDLSDFKDGSGGAWGVSAFVRAYFGYLDRRSALIGAPGGVLELVAWTQELLELLMQVRPYGDGMEVGLVMEALDCVVLESFEVYSYICRGIAKFLVGVLRSPIMESAEERRQRGVVGIKTLRRAREQSSRLKEYFEACQRLGVLKSIEFPVVDSVPEKDIQDLECLISGLNSEDEHKGSSCKPRGLIEHNAGEADCTNHEEKHKEHTIHSEGNSGTVVSKKWVVFNDEPLMVAEEYKGNPFVGGRPPSWEMNVMAREPMVIGNLIELM